MNTPQLKMLDRLYGCDHCILSWSGDHQYDCRIETARRAKAIQELINRPNSLTISLDTEAMQKAA